MKMYAKKHVKTIDDGSKRSVLALCDATVLGKVLEEGKVFLDLKTNAGFYNGTLVKPLQAQTMLEEALVDAHCSINAVGEKSVSCLAKALPSFKPEKTKSVQGVPHAHVYRV